MTQDNNSRRYNVVNFDEFIRSGNVGTSGPRELDIDQMLAQRMMTKSMGMGNPNSTCCTLTEGPIPVYRRLNTGSFPTGAANLVVFLGNTTEFSGTNKQFQVNGYKNCLLVENQYGAALDLSRITEGMGNTKQISLVEISAPFTGTILVPERCLVNIPRTGLSSNSSNGILKG